LRAFESCAHIKYACEDTPLPIGKGNAYGKGKGKGNGGNSMENGIWDMGKGMGMGMRNGNLPITGHVASKGTCYCIRLAIRLNYA